MKTQTKSHPRVTIVMTARERHALAEAAIESIVSETNRPYRFIYLDVQSPDWLRESLALRSTDWGLEVIRFDEPLWPQEARNRIANTIDTDYVVFIDNDVQVEDGWLDSLVACADDTGAGIVGPLYLQGDGIRPARIHMAGGVLTEAAAEHGRVLGEKHFLYNMDPKQVDDTLCRRPCDFVEYHCMLIRTELLRDGALLDANIRCVHEHIDTALSVKQRGYSVFIEPPARVTYLAFSDYMLDDLPFFRQRWSSVEAEANIDAFSRKWNVVNDDRSFGRVRQFVRNHVAQVDPIRSSPPMAADHHRPMRREELKQTRSDLLDFAIERGYQTNELGVIANSYHLAHILVDGGYRPCGRPFANHVVGTASVLIRYGFRAETVAAGMLHSAYTHSPPHSEGPKAAMDAMCALLGGKGSEVERRVRAYSLRESSWAGVPADFDSCSTLSVFESEILAIAAANEVEMHLSGEVRYSGRTDDIKSHVLRQISHVCQIFGVNGLSDTMELAQRREAFVRPELMTNTNVSYRIAQDKRSAVPMATNDCAALDQSNP